MNRRRIHAAAALLATCLASPAFAQADPAARGLAVQAKAAAAANATAIANVNGTLYTGHVGTRTRVPDYFSSSNKQAMCRRADWVRDDVTSGAMQLVFPNFYANANSEAAPGASRTWTADVEYPSGTHTRVTFAASNSGSMTDGQAQLVSDAVPVAIPRNAEFWVNAWQSSTAGIILSSSGFRSAVGDQVAFGTTVTDSTGSNWSAGGQNGFTCGPAAIIAPTRRPAIAAMADSEGFGIGEVNASYASAAYVGVLATTLAPVYGYLDLSRPSATSLATITNYAKRQTYLAYVTHVVNELGTNDLSAGTTVAQYQSYDASLKALAPGLTWFRTTIMPRTTSTTAISALTSSGTTATATIGATQAKALVVGETVTVAGATPSGYNGSVVVTAISGQNISYTLLAGASGLASASPTGTLSDLWASQAFQTVTAYETVRVAYNEAIRGGTVGYAGYFDIADAVESSRNSGYIKVPPQVPLVITLDGLHFTPSGWATMFPFVDPNRIRRVN